MSLEEALAQQESAVDGLLKSLSKYSSAVKGWKKACQAGHIGNLLKASALAVELSQTLPGTTAQTKEEWNFDVRAYLDSDEWLAELQRTASNSFGLRTIRDNDTLISSPLTVRSQPSRSSLALGRTNWPAIRPRIVAAELKRLRDRTLAASSQEFLESLYAARGHLAPMPGDFVRFRAIYDVFCLAPGYKKDNPSAAFAQQIYALQRSGLRTTRSGSSIEIEGPSGSYKERDIFSVIAEDGRQIRYYGVYFK